MNANETAELAEPLKEKSALWNFPIQIQMRHRAGRPDDIERSITGNLIDDADIAAAGVFCFGQIHRVAIAACCSRPGIESKGGQKTYRKNSSNEYMHPPPTLL